MELELFSDREKKLSSIIRFDMKRFDPMFYRTNLLIHSKRVYSLVKEIIPHLKSVYGDELDSEKALSLALVHDDAELVTGDVQLYDKKG